MQTGGTRLTTPEPSRGAPFVYHCLDLAYRICYNADSDMIAGSEPIMQRGQGKDYQAGDPRLIIRWARRYARSRTISFLVQWVFIVCMVVVVGIAASLTNMAYRSHNDVLVYIAVAFMGLAILILTWFSLSPWGGDLVFRVTQWLYGEEGYVSYAEEETPDRARHAWYLTTLGGGLVIYHLVGALLVSLNYLSLRNLQPYSAVYMAPFLAYMIYVQGLGFWAWLWPVCYAIHAILLWQGAPIRFTGDWTLLNMVVPVFGYGLLSILVGHAYSRYAWRKLRKIVRSGLPPEGGSDAS